MRECDDENEEQASHRRDQMLQVRSRVWFISVPVRQNMMMNEHLEKIQPAVGPEDTEESLIES